MRVGVLTGGGDCPGLNAVIRAIVRKGERTYGDELIGFLDAWDGVLRTAHDAARRSSRCAARCRAAAPCSAPSGAARSTRPTASPRSRATFARPRPRRPDRHRRQRLADASPASCTEEAGLPIVGVPKTIDNDIVGTDVTFGFNTAVQIATDAIDRLHTTAESHDRVMVVEVMGRHSGWIATYAGIAGGATVVLIPEQPVRHRGGLRAAACAATSGAGYASIVVVAEGAEPRAGTLDIGEKLYDKFGHVRLGGVADIIAREIGERTGFETRVVMLGHVQRGGTPTAFDRVLSTRFGVAAIDAVHDRRLGPDGRRPRRPTSCRRRSTLAVGKTRPVDLQLFQDVPRCSSRDRSWSSPPVRSSTAAGSAGSAGWRATRPGRGSRRRQRRRAQLAAAVRPRPRLAVDAELHRPHARRARWP